MNIKKINLSFKLTQEHRKLILKKFLANGRLLFILFWGMLFIYFFNIVYKKAYIELDFIQYAQDTSFMNTYQQSLMLEKIMQNIGTYKENVETGKIKKYNDPFDYGKKDKDASDAAKTEKVNTDNAGSTSKVD